MPDSLALFISHTTADDVFVGKLNARLQVWNVTAWVDSRRLSANDQLEPKVRAAIDAASMLLVVISEQSVKSAWVKMEVRHALDQNKKVIPLLLDGFDHRLATALLFDVEPVFIPVQSRPGGLDHALPQILTALGRQLPEDIAKQEPAPEQNIAELRLELTRLAFAERDGTRRAIADARLTYFPADPAAQKAESDGFLFRVPIAVDELGELAWYLEDWLGWSVESHQQRAQALERKLPEFGERLAQAIQTDTAGDVWRQWKAAKEPHRFTIHLLRSSRLTMDEPTEEEKSAALLQAEEAAAAIFGLPWELLHEQHTYLIDSTSGLRVRRSLASKVSRPPVVTDVPLRLLVICARPEDKSCGYLDHRLSLLPLVEALRTLGGIVEWQVLTPPTFDELKDELRRAHEAGRPYHVIHFDGHGVLDEHHELDKAKYPHALGALCFEHPDDAGKTEKRRSQLIHAPLLAAALQEHRIPLFVLEACQTAQAKATPAASVAGSILKEGVASVIATTHSIHVDAARIYVSALYQAIAAGRSIGAAHQAGERAMNRETRRHDLFGQLRSLQDWMVPVLFQEDADPVLFKALPAQQVQTLLGKEDELKAGFTPKPPAHSFVGRSRVLLAAERRLAPGATQTPTRYLVLRGEGGEGKTALAAELSRWLVLSRRCGRSAFVSLETHANAQSVLVQLGAQLTAEGEAFVQIEPARQLQLLQRALQEQATFLVWDNMESVLAPPGGSLAAASHDAAGLKRLLELASALMGIGGTRLVFTSREVLPAPFDVKENIHDVERLDPPEALALLARVLGREEQLHDLGSLQTGQELEPLLNQVGRHARAIVTVGEYIAAKGLDPTRADVRTIMEQLERHHPGERERSLLASVALSLHRLPQVLRARLAPLAACVDGVQLRVMGALLGLDVEKDEELAWAAALQQVGVAEVFSSGYLRFDPALTACLRREQSDEDFAAAQPRWAEIMAAYTRQLYQLQFKNAAHASALTLLDVGNLLGALEFRYQAAGSDIAALEAVVDQASAVEVLLQTHALPTAMARASHIRQQAGLRLEKEGGWSRARVHALSGEVDRLLDAGRAAEALPKAESLRQRCLAAGDDAYPGAAYDTATACFRLGRCLQMAGDAAAALPVLADAQKRFEQLAAQGSEDAPRMAAVCLGDMADCLLDLRQLPEAAAAYEKNGQLAKQQQDPRREAVSLTQLGTVRMLQNEPAKALEAYRAAMGIFEDLHEPKSMAVLWHQIAMVHKRVQNFSAAEDAYQKSLALEIQTGNRPGQAATLGELGNLSSARGRHEEAVAFYRRAVDIFTAPDIADVLSEGQSRNNLAHSLIRLRRYDEAREEITRAIACDARIGLVAEPWKTFKILGDLETAEGHTEAAQAARRQARDAYLAARRQGWHPESGGGHLAEAVVQALQSGEAETVPPLLQQVAESEKAPESVRQLARTFSAILLNGARDPALADDPRLTYGDAAEVLLLLERLG